MEEIKELIFDFAYHEALNDATLQNAYLGKKDKIEEITEAKKVIKEYIDCIVNGKSAWFYATEKSFESIVNKALNFNSDSKEYFTFGNTQKLINMTVKYFYMSCYFDNTLRERFANCHCPMDGKLITSVRNILQNKNMDCGEIRSDLSWSRLSDQSVQEIITENKIEYSVPKAYVEFQNAIKKYCDKENCNPVEADFKLWNK